jgi:hypothetical protein
MKRINPTKQDWDISGSLMMLHSEAGTQSIAV